MFFTHVLHFIHLYSVGGATVGRTELAISLIQISDIANSEKKLIRLAIGAFYRYVNKRIKCKSTITPLRNPEGQLCFGDDDKASLLNNYFASVGTVDNGNSLVYLSMMTNS